MLRGRKLVPLERAVQLITDEPARLFGLRDRGRLAEGCHADLVVFDPETVGSEHADARARPARRHGPPHRGFDRRRARAGERRRDRADGKATETLPGTVFAAAGTPRPSRPADPSECAA